MKLKDAMKQILKPYLNNSEFWQVIHEIEREQKVVRKYCPECHSEIRYQNGCKVCPSCGWSVCE